MDWAFPQILYRSLSKLKSHRPFIYYGKMVRNSLPTFFYNKKMTFTEQIGLCESLQPFYVYDK